MHSLSQNVTQHFWNSKQFIPDAICFEILKHSQNNLINITKTFIDLYLLTSVGITTTIHSC